MRSDLKQILVQDTQFGTFGRWGMTSIPKKMNLSLSNIETEVKFQLNFPKSYNFQLSQDRSLKFETNIFVNYSSDIN